jgi:hypothetical protein
MQIWSRPEVKNIEKYVNTLLKEYHHIDDLETHQELLSTPTQPRQRIVGRYARSSKRYRPMIEVSSSSDTESLDLKYPASETSDSNESLDIPQVKGKSISISTSKQDPC